MGGIAGSRQRFTGEAGGGAALLRRRVQYAAPSPRPRVAPGDSCDALEESDTVMLEFEKWLARVLLLNSALALAVSLGLLGQALDGADTSLVFGAALLGFTAAVLSLKRLRSGLRIGALYYAVQLLSYFPHDGGRPLSVKAGVSIGLVMQFPACTVVLNMVALALLAATVAVLLWRRREHAGAGRAAPPTR